MCATQHVPKQIILTRHRGYIFIIKNGICRTDVCGCVQSTCPHSCTHTHTHTHTRAKARILKKTPLIGKDSFQIDDLAVKELFFSSLHVLFSQTRRHLHKSGSGSVRCSTSLSVLSFNSTLYGVSVAHIVLTFFDFNKSL